MSNKSRNDYDQGVEQETPFLSHLVELRDRLLRIVGLVLVLTVALMAVANDLYYYFSLPLQGYLPEGAKMLAIGVISPVFTPFKLALIAAFFLSVPYVLHQLWSFIAPGLYQHEKKLARPLLISSIILFYLGMAFAYYVVFPLVFEFTSNFASEGVDYRPDIASYLDFAIKLFFAFGVAFEVPIATIMLILAGVTTPEALSQKRPYIIVGAFVVGMLLTPPDIISQTLLALPMWLLFEVGVIFGRIMKRKREETAAAEDEETEQDEAPLSSEEMEAEMEAELERAIAEEDALKNNDETDSEDNDTDRKT
ncbi:MAG: twin-arginine translocase subunit TatC [Thiohalophilus sp.]|uniref:twin-arginine translocase subunit TatC n=1 Tax=Thiohalophilus sp. TaxID=3028392 RepID=UPI00287016E6|nr:twin-arginine translocase subunit TatC [Thiohalophilus sp.]MDR9436530.1 twin-arginine translocase subunit TatC [Thiohalophilus sp.]